MRGQEVDGAPRANKPEPRPRAGPALALDYRHGTGQRRRGGAAPTSEDTIELDERASAEIVAQAAGAASFSIHLPGTNEAEAAPGVSAGRNRASHRAAAGSLCESRPAALASLEKRVLDLVARLDAEARGRCRR